MDKIFSKTLKTLFWWLFKLSKPNPSNLIFKIWDPSLFLLFDVKLLGEKIEKNNYLEILHCRQTEKGITPHL